LSKYNRRVLGLALIIVVAVVAIGGYLAYQALYPPIKLNSLKIGVVGPFTGFGAAWGAYYKEGSIFAAERINNAGGVLGTNITLVFGDTESSSAVAATVAERLVTVDQVDALVGEPYSSSVLAIMEVAARNHIIYIASGGGTNLIEQNIVNNLTKYKYIWHTWPGADLYVPPMMASLTATFKTAGFNTSSLKVFMIQADTDQGRSEGPVFKARLEAEGWDVLQDIAWVSSTETNFYPLLTNIKSITPDPLLILTTLPSVPSAVALIKQMRELELNSLFWIPGATGNHPDFIAGAGVYANCSLNGELFLPFSADFITAFTNRFGHAPTYLTVLQYESINMLVKAIVLAKSKSTDAIIVEMPRTDYTGIGGRYAFNTTTHGLRIGPEYLPVVQYELMDGIRYILYPPSVAVKNITLPSWFLK
jgi:branched-chain amino acid transport system substrate-binding protein